MPITAESNGRPRIIALRNGGTPTSGSAQEKFYIEDGWVFREHHGKYVECICRSEDILITPAQPLPVTQLA